MGDSKLSLNWIRVARVGWFLITLFFLTLFLLGIPYRYEGVRAACDAPPCPPLSLSSADATLVESTFFSMQGYATFHIGLELITAVTMSSMASLLFWKYFDNVMGILTAFLLTYMGLAMFGHSGAAFAAQYPSVGLINNQLVGLFPALLLLLIFIFPNGRFLNNFTLLLFVLFFSFFIIRSIPVILNGDPIVDPSNATGTAIFLGMLSTGVFSQIYRYRNVSTPIEKQQMKWVLLGFASLILNIGAYGLFIEFLPPSTPRGLLLVNTLGLAMIVFIACIFPVSMMIAILRYRLWNIDIIINRTLVYGGLTLLIVAVYTLVVGGLGLLFQASGNLIISLIATALVALLFQPARDRLQNSINRLMFGERNNPYAVLSTLGQQLQTTAVPSETLDALVHTLTTTLKLPYAAIELVEDGERIKQAAVGEPIGQMLELPLQYQKEAVGHLVVSHRSPGEEFTRQERQLFNSIAAQIGPVASATRLTTALQHARERLVLTREEERRRIRRDLHDGLGPSMASQTLRLEAVLDVLLENPQLAFEQVEQLKTQTQAMVADIRRLVYELYPSALDELGLVAALRAHIGQMHGIHGRFPITVQAEQEPLPRLPAAIEVAAYRITLEAVTNAVRHAEATRCEVVLAVQSGRLHLTIQDDGIGLPASYQPGIGLTSMQERAEELGGSLEIVTSGGNGTLITAVLPYDRR